MIIRVLIIFFASIPIQSPLYHSFRQTHLPPYHFLIVVYWTSFSETSLSHGIISSHPILSPPLSRSPPPFSAFHLMLFVGSRQHRPLHSRIPLQACSHHRHCYRHCYRHLPELSRVVGCASMTMTTMMMTTISSWGRIRIRRRSWA